jgi:hypothetical protein
VLSKHIRVAFELHFCLSAPKALWEYIMCLRYFPPLSLLFYPVLSLPPLTCGSSVSYSANFTLSSLPFARFVSYMHRAFGSPSISTFTRALSRGFIHGISTLTASLVRKFPPLSLSTSFGHLDLLRQGSASTRKLCSDAILSAVTPPIPRTSPRILLFPVVSPSHPV